MPDGSHFGAYYQSARSARKGDSEFGGPEGPHYIELETLYPLFGRYT